MVGFSKWHKFSRPALADSIHACMKYGKDAADGNHWVLQLTTPTEVSKPGRFRLIASLTRTCSLHYRLTASMMANTACIDAPACLDMTASCTLQWFCRRSRRLKALAGLCRSTSLELHTRWATSARLGYTPQGGTEQVEHYITLHYIVNF